MSMIPFFPSLKPSVANRLWFDMANDDEVQTKRYEDERRNWVCLTSAYINNRVGLIYWNPI